MKGPGFFLFLFPVLALAQGGMADSLASRIDLEVWQPFRETYNAYDAEGFNAVHTDDVLRITPYGIRQGEEYKEQNRIGFARDGQPDRQIELRFEHRIFHDDVAYEVGYYRVRYFKDGRQTQEHFGRFQVLLRKVQGRWRIAQDWDSSNINGHEVNAEDFERLKP